jgi:ribosomal protein L11 methyltransferase
VLALVVDVPAEVAEVAADALWSLGVLAVEEREGAPGRTELWTSLGDERDEVLAAVSGFPVEWRVRFEEVDDAVVDTWREFATPIPIDDGLVVVPSWRSDDVAPAAIAVRIDPGAAFGMGDHPTTVLCLRTLRPILATRTSPTVLDVGCGSGVLAVAAVRLGAADALAIDISPAAAAVTTENARRNGVEHAVHASTTPLAAVHGTYEVVLANILAPALVELAADLRRVLAPNGVLVVSGILANRHDHVLAALAPLRVARTDVLDGWAAVTLTH